MNSADVKIAFFDAKSYDQKFFDAANERYGYGIDYFETRLNRESLPLVQNHTVVCPFVNDTINGEVIEGLVEKGAKLIAMRCAGYNNVDLKAAYDSIHVVRVPEYSPYAVAEHAAALMLSLNRKIHKAFYRVRDNNFSIKGLLGFDMRGKTAGVVGTGRIGRAMIDILKGFGMEVVAFDVKRDESFAKEKGFSYVELEALYAKSDVITLHCPLTNDNYHMIDDDAINAMKDGVMLINTSRGHLVDTEALVNGLKKEKISAAGLDVYEEESDYFFEDRSDEIILDDLLARLNSFNNVLITSHQGFFTKEALTNIAETTLRNVSDFLKDNKLDNEVCYRCGQTPCPKKSKDLRRCF